MGGRRLLAACVVVCALAAPASAATEAEFDFVWPAQGTITTPFIPGTHEGIDIGELQTLTVRAAVWGIVEKVGEQQGFEGYGNIVLIRVTPTLETLYAHLDSWSVKPGDPVFANDPIGIAGCTGMCTGTHLHFEVRDDGAPVDPMQFLHE
jgi:murein DD-endopeptidase MepM/ murein hydrolase activator NlpD